jgi:hypothetical protein
VGFFEEFGPHGTRRGETFTCAHCQKVVEIVPKGPMAVCPREFKPVCMRCHRKCDMGICKPIERLLDEYEKRIRARAGRESILKAAGIGSK